MTKKEKKIFSIYVLFVLIFLLLTTKYLSLSDIIHVASQWDVISYTEIAKYAPNLPYDNENIMNFAPKIIEGVNKLKKWSESI